LAEAISNVHLIYISFIGTLTGRAGGII
jgi:hypothetical protein